MSFENRQEFLSDTKALDNYRKGFAALRNQFAAFLAIIVAVFFATLPNTIISLNEELPRTLDLASTAYTIFVLTPLGMGVSYAFLKAARGEAVAIGDLLAPFQRNYIAAVGAGFLSSLFIAVGLLFFIAPGLYIAIRMAFVAYLVVDENMDVLEAIRASWEMTGSYGFTIFTMGVLAVVAFVVGLFLLVIGAFFAALWVQASFAVLYHAVATRDGVPGQRKQKAKNDAF